MVSRIDWESMPVAVAYAFTVAHRPSDVYAALRFYDRWQTLTTGSGAVNFLTGSHFPEYWELPAQGCPAGFEDHPLFEDIRESAQAYLETIGERF